MAAKHQTCSMFINSQTVKGIYCSDQVFFDIKLSLLAWCCFVMIDFEIDIDLLCLMT